MKFCISFSKSDEMVRSLRDSFNNSLIVLFKFCIEVAVSEVEAAFSSEIADRLIIS